MSTTFPGLGAVGSLPTRVPERRRAGRDHRQLHGHQRAEITDALRSGRDVLVDATHVRRESRDRLLATAELYGAPVTAVFFDRSLPHCLAAQRTRDWRAAVPADVIRTMARDFRFLTPDEYSTLLVVDDAGEHIWDDSVRWAPRA